MSDNAQVADLIKEQLANSDFYLIRTKEVCKRRAISLSTHYSDVSEGLWTKPLKIGLRASAWPNYEVDILISAKIASLSDKVVRELVVTLELSRRETTLSWCSQGA